jgi:hypothetical protein
MICSSFIVLISYLLIISAVLRMRSTQG